MEKSTKAGLAMVFGGMLIVMWYMASPPESSWHWGIPPFAIIAGWITCAGGWTKTNQLIAGLVGNALQNFLVQGIGLILIGQMIFGSDDLELGDYDPRFIGALLLVLGMARILLPGLKWLDKQAKRKASDG